MRRILLVMSVAALMVAMLAATAVPAFATIHPLVNSDRSADAANGTPADTRNPPGITSEGHEPGYTDPDPDKATEAQPILSVLKNPTATAHAFK
jgi:hypothetical protein